MPPRVRRNSMKAFSSAGGRPIQSFLWWRKGIPKMVETIQTAAAERRMGSQRGSRGSMWSLSRLASVGGGGEVRLRSTQASDDQNETRTVVKATKTGRASVDLARPVLV